MHIFTKGEARKLYICFWVKPSANKSGFSDWKELRQEGKHWAPFPHREEKLKDGSFHMVFSVSAYFQESIPSAYMFSGSSPPSYPPKSLSASFLTHCTGAMDNLYNVLHSSAFDFLFLSEERVDLCCSLTHITTAKGHYLPVHMLFCFSCLTPLLSSLTVLHRRVFCKRLSHSEMFTDHSGFLWNHFYSQPQQPWIWEVHWAEQPWLTLG